MTEKIKEAFVKADTINGITTIAFFHPQSNSLPAGILETLANYIHTEGLNEETKVIVLRSAGEKAFCAGASFDELMEIKTEDEGSRFFSGFANVINAMRKCPKFIIARVHGKCVGGGVGLAAAADYVIALEGAEIKLSEFALGIGPFVVGPAIERKIGFSSFSQLAIDANMWRNGDWARRKGLFAELHPTPESMEHSIERLSNALAQYSPEATIAMKQMFWKGTEHWDELLKERAAVSGKLVLSQFTREFIKKFKEKKA